MDKAGIGLDNSNISLNISHEVSLAAGSIPTYALYGELNDDLGTDWVHCETIQVRSRLHNYRIQPHRHEKLFQILYLKQGEAQIVIDGRTMALESPSVVTLPPMTVHGYAFSPEVEGTVLTVFESRLADIFRTMPDIRDTFRSVRLIDLHDHQHAAQRVAADLEAITAEFASRSQGRLGAIEAYLALIFITLHRLQGPGANVIQGPGQRALQHAIRFRELVDQDFRSHKSVDVYARRLGLTATHLNRICREHLGDTALGVIHQRVIVEAKRYLTFTTLSAKEVALALAFDDPAYFNRFFKQKTGLSPLNFRALQQSTMA